MQLAHQLTVQEYLTFLRASATEPQELLNDLLISVTMFFRDPEAWAALQAQVIGPLVEHAEADMQIRLWAAGCASGEEAYSLAILFCEAFERRKQPANFIVFASDVDESALAVAREGLYPQAISADVSESRLERFFRVEDDHYRVTTEVRDHIVFASHSLLRDPPFSRVHLIACRNVLIYLDRELQEQVMSVFRYASRDDATLFLGLSESASDELFQPVDKKHGLFGIRRREDGARPSLPDILSPPLARVRPGRDWRGPSSSTAAEIHLSALEQAAPPSVLVDDRWNVLHLSPTAARFFQQGAGALARRVTDLVRPEIRNEMYALLQRATDDPAPQLSAFFPIHFDGPLHRMAVLVQQRPHGGDGRRDMLVTFLDAGPVTVEAPGVDQEPSNELVRSLQEKLRLAEQHAEGMRDDQHLTTEDLRAANEELQSLNEEYRSTTEELETSKEELQSINEELHTVNNELKVKLDEVSRAHDDLENLMAATNVATLFLTSDLRIKRFTPQLGEIFKIKSRDLDRPIGDLKHTLDYDVEEDARRVLATVTPLEREARGADGRIYVVRLGPYRTARGRDVDGVVVTFIDVSAIKGAEEALRQSEARLASELNVMRRLHAMTLAVATASSMRQALDHVLAAAIDLHAADRGNVQLLDPGSSSLRIVAQNGFEPAFMDRFALVTDEDESACGRALRTKQTVQIDDVASDAAYAPYRAAAAEAGYQAVQSAPLIGRNGTVLGVLSVHFRTRHMFSERDRQLGDVLGRVAADMIESRSQHDSVQALNASLRLRTAELEGSRDQLARQAAELTLQDRNREEFLAVLGHELRNPLSAIQSSIAVVRVEEDRSRRALAVVERQAQHMTRLINDLLDMTRVRHGRVRLERQAMDLNQAVASAVDTARPRADSKGLRIESDVPRAPLIVDGDPERVAQILDNLLRNAIGYTDQGTVTVRVHHDDAGVARVAVQDTGIGIEHAEAAHVFEPYQRGVNNRRREGLGLGLALVKSLVEAHGGEVAVESDGPGAGSTFSVTIPLAGGPVAPPTVERVAQPSKRRVLVVDDQRDVADMLGALLETLGQDVAVAYDATTAVALARDHRPRVAFLDVWMPGVTGSQLAHQLREEFAPGELTLVAVTGHDKDNPRVLDGHFDQHLLKPVSVENVVALLNAVDAGTDTPSQ
jgi:two-component system CheB/CheR fusion protein